METNLCFSMPLYILLCLLLTTLVSATEHIATFSIKGVAGTVSFNTDATSGGVRINVNALTGLAGGEEFDWSIRSLPMLYDREDKCAEEFVGPVFKNLTTLVGPLANVTGGSEYVDATLTLAGADSISGRTLAIDVGTTATYCASILPVDVVLTAVAQFGTPFAGTVTFRQRAADPAADTTIFVDLFDVTEPIAAEDYNWVISDNTDLDIFGTLDSWCTATADGAFNAIGDLSAVLGSVNVNSVNRRQRYFYVASDIALAGANSIVNKSLVFLGASDAKAACSPIRLLQSKTVRSVMNLENVTGSIEFTQASPWEATIISVDLKNIRGKAGGYHVHKFPVQKKILTEDFPGSADWVAGHFNPYNIDTTSDPDYPNGTNDQYEIGDISGKFGTLDGFNDFTDVFTDWNMPLFGQNSIVGRSIIIHLPSSARWIYAPIGYPTSLKTITAVFTYPLVGEITFRQDPDDPYSDASVFLDLAHSDGEGTTEMHDWHIHVAKLGDDHLDQAGRCASTLGHFNPLNVKLTEEYATECSTLVTRRCEIGDFSKKYGRITVPGDVRTQVGKYFFTDVQLPLSGVYTIADRSVVVHVKDGAPERLSCGDTLEVFEAITTTVEWNDNTPITGSVVLSQFSEFDPLTITANVAGLGSLVGPWHVHVLPVPYADDSPCSATGVQGHYNPFGVMGSPDIATVDYYELGDFSGKFDYWDGLDTVMETYIDPSSSLFGPRSLTGRSIVMHLSSDGSRYRCATLQPLLEPNDFRIEARADITTSAFSGYMILGQTIFSNGRLSETTMEAYFTPTDTDTSDVYDWTIRTGDLSDGSCDSAATIYNPFTVATDGAYATQCGIGMQLRCQVGDLLGKNGNYSSYGGRTLLTDINLPLTGTSGVIGRPLYVESTNGAGVGCAVVTPLVSTGVETSITFPKMIDFDAYAFKNTVAAMLTDVEPWQIVAPHYPVDNEALTNCMDLQLWIIGPDAEDAREEVEEKSADDELGLYSMTDRCRGDGDGGTGASVQHGPFSAATIVLIATVASLWQRIMAS